MLVFHPSQICLGEKAREEMNLVEILPPAGQDNRKRKAITLASLRASVLPMVSPSRPRNPGLPPAEALLRLHSLRGHGRQMG